MSRGAIARIRKSDRKRTVPWGELRQRKAFLVYYQTEPVSWCWHGRDVVDELWDYSEYNLRQCAKLLTRRVLPADRRDRRLRVERTDADVRRRRPLDEATEPASSLAQGSSSKAGAVSNTELYAASPFERNSPSVRQTSLTSRGADVHREYA